MGRGARGVSDEEGRELLRFEVRKDWGVACGVFGVQQALRSLGVYGACGLGGAWGVEGA